MPRSTTGQAHKRQAILLAVRNVVFVTLVALGPHSLLHADEVSDPALDVKVRAALYHILDFNERALQPSDVTGDGVPDVVVSSGGRWLVLAHQEDGSYTPVLVNPALEEDIADLVMLDISGDGRDDAIIATGESIRVERAPDFCVAFEFVPAAFYPVECIEVGDVDADGGLEFVIVNGQGVSVYSLAGQLEWSSPGNVDSIALANTDEDAALEIVVGRSVDPPIVLDGATGLVEWTRPSPGSSNRFAVVDFDGDGIDEVVFRIFQDLEAYSIADDEVIWVYQFSFGSLDTFGTIDLGNDGSEEFAFTATTGVAIEVIGESGDIQASIPSPAFSGLDGFTLADFDGDGVAEFFMLDRQSTPPPDPFFVVDSVTSELEWTPRRDASRYPDVAIGDIDGDGELEFIFPMEYEEGGPLGFAPISDRVLARDAITLEPEASFGVFFDPRRVATGNIDEDPQDEVFVTGDLFDSRLECWDLVTETREWFVEFEDADFSAMEAADVDGDGIIEIVVVDESFDFVRVLSGEDGSLEDFFSVSSMISTATLTPLRIGNVVEGPDLEIVAASGNGRIVVYSTADGAAQTENLSFRSFDLYDENGDGLSTVFGVTQGGDVRRVQADGSVGPVLTSLPIPRTALRVIPFGDGEHFGFVTSNGTSLQINSGTPPYGLLWESGRLGREVAADQSLHVGDYDSDGRPEIGVAVDQDFLVLQINDLLVTPFLRGDADGDGRILINDAILTLLNRFEGSPVNCVEALDFNDDSAVDAADGISLLMYLYGGGVAPSGPFPICGFDSNGTPTLSCEATSCP